LLCSFVAIDLFLGLDTRLVVGMKAAIERHTVKGYSCMKIMNFGR